MADRSRREEDSSPSPSPLAENQGRLWTPWRMHYVAGGTREDGCVFCNRFAEEDDVAGLILHRGDRAFVIMNLFPYNTGHVMLVPNAHIASPEIADVETLAELSEVRAPILRAARRALSPDGFNLGLNIGTVAGAGVADHLHEHIVPRWQGDTNFMPILASTLVMPELLTVTYAKLRAEIERELRGDNAAVSVVLSADGEKVLVDDEYQLPQVAGEDGEPLWRSVLRDTHAREARDIELVGWGGETRAGGGPVVFLLRDTSSPELPGAIEQPWIDVTALRRDADRKVVRAIMLRVSQAE